MDRLGALSAFVRAAEHRSFTIAGRELGISASGVGKAVSRLEERLGVRLFNRSTRSIALTTEGTSFLVRCQAVFKELDAAERELAESLGTPRGILRVSLPLIGMVMLPSLAGFATSYPDIQLELDFSDRLVDVIEEGFDAVIRTGTPSDSRLKAKRIGTYGYVIVGSPTYLAKRGAPMRPPDLAEHACLFHRWPATGTLERWIFSGSPNFEPKPTLTASTMEPLIEFAERGLGLVYTPTFTVKKQLASGTLRTMLEPHLPAVGTLQALYPASRHPTPKVAAFVDYMARHVLDDQPTMERAPARKSRRSRRQD